MRTLEILIEARQLIADPENWGQGQMEHEVAGVMRYCAAGAVFCAARKKRRSSLETIPALVALATATQLSAEERAKIDDSHGHGNAYVWHIASYNDRSKTSHADVLAMFDRAIAAQREETIAAIKRGVEELLHPSVPEVQQEGGGAAITGSVTALPPEFTQILAIADAVACEARERELENA